MRFFTHLALTTVFLARLCDCSLAADDRSRCASDQPRPDRVIAACQRLVAANPGDLPAVARLGRIMWDAKRYADCIDVISKGITTIANPDRDSWPFFYVRGMCYERADQWENSEPDLRKALALNPDEPHVLNYLGYSLADRGLSLDEALKLLRRAVEQVPDDGYMVDSLGWAYFRVGKNDEACETLERAVRLKPNDPLLNDHLGDVYAKLGRRNEARAQWRRARELGPEPENLRKIEDKLASTPADETTSRDVAGTSLDACKPGLTEITPAARRANLNALQERFNVACYPMGPT